VEYGTQQTTTDTEGITTLTAEKNKYTVKATFEGDTATTKILPKARGAEAECGNGMCEEGETGENCPNDCKETPIIPFTLDWTLLLNITVVIVAVILAARLYYARKQGK
jgi:hypothetical protein